MADFIICTSPNASHLVPSSLSRKQVKVSQRTFPDGELCIHIDADLKDKTVFLVQNTPPPQEKNLQILYQMVEVAKFHGAKEIICVVPYLAYSRQDRRTDVGEPESGLIVLRTLSMLGANLLVTVDIHNPMMCIRSPLRTVNLSTAELFSSNINENLPKNAILISPDEGGTNRIEAISKLTNLPIHICKKKKDFSGRTWYEGEEMKTMISNRDLFVYDDLCSSGSTFVPLAMHLWGMGARNIYYGVTHFFVDWENLKVKMPPNVSIWATNTIESRCSNIQISPIIGHWITNYINKSELE